MKTIPAKTLVSRTKYPDYWFGNDYNMNIYRGCNQGCIYCDSRSLCYGNPDFDHVAIKNNVLGILEKELAGKRKKGVIGTGSMSDPYNSYEARELASRNALEILKKYGFGVSICTKNTMVCRDIDLLQGISASSSVTVCMTITAADDSISGKIEPGAPSSKERFKAISKLSEAGIYCGVLMMPLLTGITDTGENIRGLVEMAKESGADFIYPAFGFTMRDGSREYLYRKLDELFPGLREEYTERYGASYRCDVPDGRKLSGLFEKLCEGYKIVYKMNDIIEMSADRVRNRQMTLF